MQSVSVCLKMKLEHYALLSRYADDVVVALGKHVVECGSISKNVQWSRIEAGGRAEEDDPFSTSFEGL